MAKQWFYQANGKELGPVSSSELKSLADSGVLTPASSIRQNSSFKWYEARRVTGLFPSDCSDLNQSGNSEPGTTPSPSNTPPPLVLGQNLLPGESVITSNRVHPLIFVMPIAIAFVTIIVVPCVFMIARKADYEEQREAGVVVGYAMLALGAFFVIRSLLHCLFVYWGHKVVLTNKRIIGHRGILNREKTNILLHQIEAIQVKQSLLGSLLNYGTICVGGTGSSMIKFMGIKDAVSFQQLVNQYVDGART